MTVQPAAKAAGFSFRRAFFASAACWAVEDGAAAKLGMPLFLLTDCLINKAGVDINAFPHGGFEELQLWLREQLN